MRERMLIFINTPPAKITDGLVEILYDLYFKFNDCVNLKDTKWCEFYYKL